LKLGEMPKRINFSAKVVPIVKKLLSESLEELKKEIEEEEKRAKEEMSRKIEKIKSVGGKVLKVKQS